MPQKPGWLEYIGDEILPSDIGFIITHEIRIPSLTNQDDQWKVVRVFFVAHMNHGYLGNDFAEDFC